MNATHIATNPLIVGACITNLNTFGVRVKCLYTSCFDRSVLLTGSFLIQRPRVGATRLVTIGGDCARVKFDSSVPQDFLDSISFRARQMHFTCNLCDTRFVNIGTDGLVNGRASRENSLLISPVALVIKVMSNVSSYRYR